MKKTYSKDEHGHQSYTSGEHVFVVLVLIIFLSQHGLPFYKKKKNVKFSKYMGFFIFIIFTKTYFILRHLFNIIIILLPCKQSLQYFFYLSF